MIFGIIFFYHFDPYNVFLAIATNIPQRLKTGFVVQGHKYYLKLFFKYCFFLRFFQPDLTAIRTYFTRWLIRTNSYNLTLTNSYNFC